MGQIIRVLIAARSDVVLFGLRSVLATDRGFHVVGTLNRAFAIADVISRTAPDVVLIEDPVPECPDSASAHVREASQLPIVVLATGRPVRDKTRLFERGINGLLHLSAEADEIRIAVRAVVKGEPVLDRRFVGPFVIEVLRKTRAHRKPLSFRETEVMHLVAEGLTDADIAVRLGLSANTVRTYIRRTLTKLGSPSRAAAVMQVARWQSEMGAPSE